MELSICEENGGLIEHSEDLKESFGNEPVFQENQ